MTLPYRPNVCMLILNDQQELLLIHEKGETDTYWKFPQGGIEKGEKPEEAIRRELQEEVGITEYQILAQSAHIHRYDWPEEMQKRKGYRGQEQYVYLISATRPKQAKPMEEGILRVEWVPIEEALKRFQFPNQINATKKVWEEFEPIVRLSKELRNKPRMKNVAIGIIRKGKNILFTKRQEKDFLGYERKMVIQGKYYSHSSDHPEWELPGGKIDEGESCEMAIERETKEEVGFDVEATYTLPMTIYGVQISPNRSFLFSLKVVECTLLKETPFHPNPEVSQIEWLGPRDINQMQNPVIQQTIQKRP